MYLIDYHMHSNNSNDGVSTIDEMCQKALKMGMDEIAITDHFEPTYRNQKYPEYNAESYFQDVMQAQKKYDKSLKIKFAVELGQPHLYPKYSGKLIDEHKYDYVLASVHNLTGDVDIGMVDFSRGDIDPNHIFEQYFIELMELVNWGKFDCIGHFDLPKRYSIKYGIELPTVEYMSIIEEILKKIIYEGKGIEVNTSGLRGEALGFLPEFSIIKLYKNLGGEVITIGSDAHLEEHVGTGIIKGLEIIKNAGFKYISTYNNRKCEQKKIL